MTSRSTRVLAVAGACRAGTSRRRARPRRRRIGGGLGGRHRGLLRSRPAPTRRSRARSASARRCRCPAAPPPRRSSRPPAASRRTSTTPTRTTCCPATSSRSTIGDDQYDPALTPGVVNGLIDDGVAPVRRHHRHAEQPRRARHAQRGVHPAAQRCSPATRGAVRSRTTRGPPACSRRTSTSSAATPRASPRTSPTRPSACSSSTTSSATSRWTTSATPPTRPGWRSSASRRSSVGDEAPPQAQVSSLAEAAPGRAWSTSRSAPSASRSSTSWPTPRRANPDWEPVVYMTNTCAAAR